MEKANGTPIRLKHVTDIRDGSRKETIVLEAHGLYYIKENASYLTFEESQDIGNVKTVVKITKDEVVVIRSGAVQMRHVFRKKQETSGNYRTPFGVWTMKTKTDHIEYWYEEKTKKGKLFLSYTLEMQHERVGRHAVTITFREEL
ncbi:DUF1934 domain-containing protein [Anoxybacillus rupiensis]|jgi:uncharacterized beta-barrel protein YwiB (DUF1934 family)|uniref:DUF1934 domain-containing protein n=1 Tax=Anoxybacteroides rupiense TaxID=311460 RepID=A0ABD5IVG3_9BACL|nr:MULTISPECIES: DUF1934 domain-containing protein [Anoxybacillus]KXG08549.1 putative beta-barrel protein YwiB [Anoxybacillus sp. P3H1B]MBB3908267.1 uncharacterized beta-barrel protein YwiB (DUF1934 family) [Anoxybacillus rupiensis]MBS2771381.1 DUF1934 domain-containing protein [Anoxybacillus rupiensis]MDE8563917.1 DUF1934 domain-containing protein [Anoxybacillus rupiensis]MED5052312.1 DUF1934 domain-containing protein [Anoxybacillus rupiensis]